ncbi:TonB-dependent receptor [Flavobacterium sp.]|uniref:TonB-dependent receptor n=1 Tax=Flavobacterium sp. TaxID=239 RepID=UPI0035AD8D2B
MMKNNLKYTVLALSLAWSSLALAQKKQEKMRTEEVNVVKSYTPTISDAFKIKETPLLSEEGRTSKENVKYNIFSFPVASTFTPSKGSAEDIEKEEIGRFYKSYATLGAGNYGTLNAELFATQDLNNEEYIAGMLRHLSSQGGIKGVALDNSFYDTSLDLTYGAEAKELSWNINLGYQNQIYHWYGLPTNFMDALTPTIHDIIVAGINPKQSYNTITLDSKIEFDESILEASSFKFAHFSDAFGSSENRFYAKPSFQFPAFGKQIKLNAIVDYLGGKFENNYTRTNSEPLEYGYTNFGLSPSYELEKDNWTLHLGLGLYYSLDTKNSNNKLFWYPQVTASHKIVGDLMIFYTGAEGGLDQNSYLNFVDENPFLSPTLQIAPTNKKYDVFAGLKGKLADNISYNIRGSFLDENNKALFKSNDFSANFNNQPYAYGNSLQVVYDNVKTVRFFGELKADITEAIHFGANGTFSVYNTKTQAEAWNLPAIQLNANVDYTINTKWYAGADVFFVGSRKDLQINTDLITFLPLTYVPTTLKSYIDLNAHVGYKHSERLTAFLKANNIANKAYQKWLNYPVQGFQVVLGANYKFDF